MRCDFSIAVWGAHHTTVYCEAALPTQLANLEEFPWLGDSLYRLYTTEQDAEVIEADPNFKTLTGLLQIQKILITERIGPSKWETVRYCHQDQVLAADNRDAALFFLCADQLWSQGSFTNAVLHLEDGRTAVMCAGPRAALEPVLPKVGSRPSGRDLVRLLIDHPHTETRDWTWDSPNYFQYGTYIYFAVPDGLLAFCYIMHPLAVKPEIKHAPFHRVFDQDWLANACPTIHRLYPVIDSDEACQIELSPADMDLPSQPSNPHLDPIAAMAWYAEATYNQHHRTFARRPVHLHAGPVIPEEWEGALTRGREVVDGVATWLGLPDEVLLNIHPENLMRRVNTRARFSVMTSPDLVLLRSVEARLPLHQHREPWRAGT